MIETELAGNYLKQLIEVSYWSGRGFDPPMRVGKIETRSQAHRCQDHKDVLIFIFVVQSM